MALPSLLAWHCNELDEALTRTAGGRGPRRWDYSPRYVWSTPCREYTLTADGRLIEHREDQDILIPFNGTMQLGSYAGGYSQGYQFFKFTAEFAEGVVQSSERVWEEEMGGYRLRYHTDGKVEWLPRLGPPETYITASDMRSLGLLRERMLDGICRTIALDGYHPMAEGDVILSLVFPDFLRDPTAEEGPTYALELFCYLTGPGEQSFTGPSLAACLGQARMAVEAWLREVERLRLGFQEALERGVGGDDLAGYPPDILDIPTALKWAKQAGDSTEAMLDAGG